MKIVHDLDNTNDLIINKQKFSASSTVSGMVIFLEICWWSLPRVTLCSFFRDPLFYVKMVGKSFGSYPFRNPLKAYKRKVDPNR